MHESFKNTNGKAKEINKFGYNALRPKISW